MSCQICPALKCILCFFNHLSDHEDELKQIEDRIKCPFKNCSYMITSKYCFIHHVYRKKHMKDFNISFRGTHIKSNKCVLIDQILITEQSIERIESLDYQREEDNEVVHSEEVDFKINALKRPSSSQICMKFAQLKENFSLTDSLFQNMMTTFIESCNLLIEDVNPPGVMKEVIDSIGTTFKYNNFIRKGDFLHHQSTRMSDGSSVNYISLKKTLDKMMKEDYVRNCVLNREFFLFNLFLSIDFLVKQSSEGLKSFMDGSIFKAKFGKDNALIIELFIDDFKLTDSFINVHKNNNRTINKNKTSHKLCGVYFTIHNLDYHNTTRINDVKLLMVVTRHQIKTLRLKIVLNPLLEELKNLHETGYVYENMEIPGKMILLCSS